MAKIFVNGEPKEYDLPITVEKVIMAEGVEQPEMVSVQVNATFISRNEFATRELVENDEVDFLYFMGGGENV